MAARISASPTFRPRQSPEYRDPADVPVAQQARGADRVFAFIGEKMHGFVVFGVPLQFRRNRLFGNEDRFADAAQLGIVLLPVGYAYADLIHLQTPNCPV